MEQIQGALGRGRGRGRPILSANSSKSMPNEQYSSQPTQASEQTLRSSQYEAVFEHVTVGLNPDNLINPLKSRLSETSKPYVSSHSFGHHEQTHVVDANNNIRVTAKKKYKKSSKKLQFHSTLHADEDDDLCPVCDRPTGKIMCNSCGSIWKGRVRTSCPMHSKVMFLMDSEWCTKCQSKDIVEVDQ